MRLCGELLKTRADSGIGKTTPSGRRRTRTADKSLKSDSEMSTYHSRYDDFHLSFRQHLVRADTFGLKTAKIGSLNDVTESEDPEGLRVFYYLVQDLRALVFSLISLHFKV